MPLTLDLSPELESRLVEEAARRQLEPTACARSILEERLNGPPRQAARDHAQGDERDAVAAYRGLPRGSVAELAALAQEQGAPLAVDWESLPEDPGPHEAGDDFTDWLRGSRRDEERDSLGKSV